MRDLRSELEMRVLALPPRWWMAEGAIIAGEIKAMHWMETAALSAWVCVIDDDETGPRSVWIVPSALRIYWARKLPKVGDRIGIKCLGKQQPLGKWEFVLRLDRHGAKAAKAATADDDDDDDERRVNE